MNDFKHLFGGMCGAVALLALYILAWGVIQRCHGATIKRVAPDGVNEITIEVDENGYVQSERMTCVHVPERYIPQSGERVIIGDFEYIMVSVGDWTRWTNAVARLEMVAKRRWDKEHATVDGRRFWHGNATNRVVSTEEKTVTWFYPDGYEYVENMPKSTRGGPPKRIQKPTKAAAPRPPMPPTAMPSRLRAKREAIKSQPVAKQVNATFGPGGKVINVEESK